MKRTFQPKKIHRAKKHGFLSRSKKRERPQSSGCPPPQRPREACCVIFPVFEENEMNRQRPFAARKATHVAFLCIQRKKEAFYALLPHYPQL